MLNEFYSISMNKQASKQWKFQSTDKMSAAQREEYESYVRYALLDFDAKNIKHIAES